ncbi:glutathione-dependent formaldehyde-activating enzyme [Nemania sp. FL0031]|nr:glutathione-dependent formaldehyde-activating enzyme [Nemania sp. FL0031]
MSEQQAELKTYRGNCHCAAFIYEITLPEIKQASACNCSICYKKAALWVFPKPTDVKFVKGDPSALTDYTFNKKQFTHKARSSACIFCPTCGVSLMVVGHLTPPKDGEDKLPENGVNVRTLQHGQVDVWKIDTQTFDGSSLPPAYEAPDYKGPQPAGDVEGGQVYTGSCHCGAVTVALKSKPLDKDLQGLVECNCSSCGKYGATWAYPPHAQVVIEGKENLGAYYFGKKLAGKMFCKICGVPICSEAVQDAQVSQMDEATRKWYEGAQLGKAFNLRVINGLNVNDLTAAHFDGYNYIQPKYVEP